MKNPHHEDHVKDIIETENSAYPNEEIINSFSPEEQKKIIRRVDIRLVVTMGCLFIVSLLDRTNLGAASVAG